MLPTRLQSLHLDVLASPSSLLRLLTPQANLEIFKDQTLTTVRREQPGKEIVLITAENGKQSEMSRPVVTILKYYKLQLQKFRREQQCPQYSLTSTNTYKHNTNSDKHTHACGHSVYHLSLVSLWNKSTQYIEPKM